MLEEISVKINIGPGRDLTLAAGKLAHLANGSCTVRQGDTIVFSAACSGEAKKGQDWPRKARTSSRCRSTTARNIPRPASSPAATSSAKAVPATRRS